jgi:hypothetical protein
MILDYSSKGVATSALMQEGYLETMHRPAGQEPAPERKQKTRRNAFFDQLKECNAMNEPIIIWLEISRGVVCREKKTCRLRMIVSLLS